MRMQTPLLFVLQERRPYFETTIFITIKTVLAETRGIYAIKWFYIDSPSHFRRLSDQF